MAPPKRHAPRRTPDAIAEDLGQVRRRGGLQRANEEDLASTLDFLTLTGGAPGEYPLDRARDLLVAHVRRGCETHQRKHEADKTAQAAACSLQSLLLRPSTDTRLAQVIRRECAKAVHHVITSDAVRHREDKIIDEIAEAAFVELQNRRTDEPQSLEGALHRLLPIVADLRQQLHDGLCLTYQNVPPASPRERRAIEGYYRQVVIKLGDLLLASVQLATLGLKTANMTADEQWFVARARNINAMIFEEAGDREYMLGFARANQESTFEAAINRLLETERGRALYARWIEWARSCFATCAFERSTDILYMCAPHALVTVLYDLEIRYLELGFSEMDIPGNNPIMHHRLSTSSGRAE